MTAPVQVKKGDFFQYWQCGAQYHSVRDSCPGEYKERVTRQMRWAAAIGYQRHVSARQGVQSIWGGPSCDMEADVPWGWRKQIGAPSSQSK